MMFFLGILTGFVIVAAAVYVLALIANQKL